MTPKTKKTRKSKKRPSSTEHIHQNTISVCMIVKDEEKFLDNCLKSVKDIADEIIIIDTGSQDNTVNIAKKYTDKIYFHPWQDSFSEARNHCFKYATGDWIFQIDADEELVKEDIPEVLNVVKNPDIDAIMVQVISSLSQGKNEGRNNVERIFRNSGTIRYEGRVHNRLVGYKKPKIYPIHFMHYGYDLKDEELSEKKHIRRITLLKKDIEEDPGNPLPYHYLSCCYLPKGLYKEALDVSLKAIGLSEKCNDQNPVFLWTRYNAAMAYYKLNDFENAESMALSTLALDDRYLDCHYILTLIYFDQSRWQKVIEHSDEYMHLSRLIKGTPDEFDVLVFNSLNEISNILILRGIAYHEKGRLIDSDKSFRAALSETDNPFPLLRAIGIFYHNKHLDSQAREFLERALYLNNQDHTVKKLLNEIGTDSKPRETISCCMIVKNEEEFLEKCLASIRDYVDELIIVDTGSTDSTVEIAKRFTDKVYFHPWENSFSKARNQALQYATCDWIFQIDGDEELMEGSGERIRHAITDAGDADIIYVNLLCSYANGTKRSLHNFERLFRNNGIIHYEGSVHNQVVGGTKAYHSSIDLWHYGYDVDEEKALKKFNRTTNLLKKEIEKDPDNPVYHHYLSVSYYSSGMIDEAHSEAVKAVELSEKQNDMHQLFAWSYFIASMSCYNLGQLEDAKKYAYKALKKYILHCDSYYILTIVSADQGKWDDVIRYGNKFLAMMEDINANNRNKGIITNTINEGPSVNILLGHAFHAKNDFEEMEHCYKKAYETADEKWQVWWNTGVYHMDKSGDLKLAERFLDLAVKMAPDEYNAWYMLAKYYNKCRLVEKERPCLEKLLEIGTNDNFIYERLFSLLINAGERNKAFGLMMEMTSKTGNIDSSLYSQLLQLGNSFIEKMDLESAMHCYTNAVEARPESPEAWSILAEITLTLGKFEDSQVFAEKALQLKGDDIMNLLTMCELKLKMRDFESHITYCDRLLKYLGLNRNRTIYGFNDLRELFTEIDNSVKKEVHCSSRINNIINELDSYITPAVQQ